MTTKEAIEKIQNILRFGKLNFSSYKTKDGVELRSNEMMVGEQIYIITPEGELPAPDGLYEIENGMAVKVKSGMIEEMEMEPNMEEKKDKVEEEVEVEMSDAELVDGTKVTNDLPDAFAIGQKLFVITETGEKVNAPVGEHTLKSGEVVVVDMEGIITGISKPDEKPEGSLEGEEMNLVETIEMFSSALEKMMNKIDSLESKQKDLNSKFSKFSSEPAAEKIYDRKGYLDSLKEEKFSKLERIAALRQK
jgi:hypothetical protein